MNAQGGFNVRLRPYEPGDRDAVLQIWREVGWVDKEAHERALDAVLESASAYVATIRDSTECLTTIHDGRLRYLDGDLPAACLTAVTTGRAARRQGLAARLAAHALARYAAQGAAVALLGIFDQGFYNRLGFGNGSYEHRMTFDPADLDVPVRPRVPVRLTLADWERMHRNRLHRLPRHGACSILAAKLTHADMLWTDNGFGLGFEDASGELTSHLWCGTKAVEHGPYRVGWLAYRDGEAFLELLALLRNLGDQIHAITLHEPQGIQLQDLVRQPFRSRRITARSPHETRISATAYWQARLLDLRSALNATQLPDGPEVRFNLSLNDPVASLLAPDAAWRGVAGDYTVTLGPVCDATAGHCSGLPTLTASVGAFTRLWLGVRPATGLSVTDALSGPEDLLGRLDRTLRLPEPRQDWDF
jgi:predicted acetyltransferase